MRYKRPFRPSIAMDLKELSAKLGLSQTTVSRALNGYSDVSERTRERVMQAAQEYGYRPNGAARRLATGKADAVGIVYPTGSGDLGDPRFVEVVAGMTDRFAQAGVDVLIASARPADELATYERLLKARRVDGFIVPHTRMDDARIEHLKASGAPFVAYGRTARPDDYAWFDFDNEAGTALAVARLADLGHKDIAYVHAPLDLTFAHQRHQGFLRGLREAGLKPVARHVVAAGFSRRGGHEAMQALLKQQPLPSAVIVDNNICGVGVVRALLDAGLAPGRDISVIVYDGMPADTLLGGIAITAIAQPEAHAAGVQLAELMLGVVDGKPLKQLQVLWQPKLAPGASDGPAPQRRPPTRAAKLS